MPALDGIRGLAVALVIAGHAFNQPGGAGLGVDLFFVLSGFLITALLLTERATTGTISLRQFYRRRGLRILPAAITFVGTFFTIVAVSAATGHASEATFINWSKYTAIALLYAANLGEAHWITHMPRAFAHLWSLAEEEQFYLLWPPVLALLLSRRRPPRAIAIILTAVASASAIEQLLLWQLGASRRRIWFAPDTHLAPIAVGCLAAVIYSHRLISDRMLVRLAPAGAVLCVVAICVPPFDHRYLYDGPFAIFPFAAATVLLAAAAGARWLALPLTFKPMRSLGRISYGLYLWHLPLVIAYGWVGIPLALGIAALSYRYVETPFLRRKRRVQTESLPDPVAVAA